MRELNPFQWAVRPLKKYAVFSGRAPRAEYWWCALFASLVGAVIGLTDYFSFSPVAGNYRPLTALFTLGLVIPGLAVAIRRLHDSDLSGWWCLLKVGGYSWTLRGAFPELMSGYQSLPALVRIPLALTATGCGLTMLVFMLARGNVGSNRYGPDPYGPGELEEVFA